MGRAPIDPRFVAGAVALLLLAAVGLWHTQFGSWRPGPGGGPAVVPQLAFWAMVPSAAAMLWAGLRTPEAARTETVPLLPVLVAVGWGLLYFWLVRGLGLVVSSVVMLAVGMIVLSPRPGRAWRAVLPIALLCGGAFWLMFTYVAPILQVRVLAF